MDYLGLGEDDAYDDYDDHDSVDRSGGVSRTADPRGNFDDSRPVARQVSPRDTDPVPTPRRPQFDDSSIQPRPMIDFSSGLCYALHGKIEKVARGVYLLKPDTRPANPEY
jgi:hypothetical protein